jgi:hypothetical protein
MPVTIIQITDHEVYTVNGKTIYKDVNENWTCNVELSTKESMAFMNYRQLIIENKDVKKHTKSTYNG